MVEEQEAYGLIIIERDEATIGLLKPSGLVVLEELTYYVPGKHHKGGQSQRRFDRIIEQLVDEFFKKVGESASRYFVPLIESGKLKGVLIGGPGHSKINFIRGNYLDYRVKKLLIGGPIDVPDQGIVGLRELVIRARDLIKGQKYLEAMEIIEEFKYHLAKDDGLAIYGIEDIEKALKMDSVDKLIIHEDHPKAEELEELARKSGAKVCYISSELPEGEWVKKTFGGVVAILRYSIWRT